MKKIALFALLSLATTNCLAFNFFHKKPEKRSYIYIVGSSTISPLMAAVSEEFASSQELQGRKVSVPLVESNGTTAGFKIFCAGLGEKYPDFVNASRAIDEDQKALCQKHGVNEIVEIKIGYDGIVFANSTESKKVNLSKEQIFLALAKKIYDKKTNQLIANPYKTWNQIDSSLPKTNIVIFGPPLTSGTRDVFIDMLVMDELCFRNEGFVKAYSDDGLRKKYCHELRTDGAFVELGENDNSIVQNLKAHKHAFGIIGYDFLIANPKTIQATSIDKVLPNSKTIISKKYPLSRPLFVYFKKQHLNLVPNIKEFIEELVNKETIGSYGYLTRNGLVAMDDSELNEVRKQVLSNLK